MDKTLYIFGAGIHARKVLHYARLLGFNIAAFIDESSATFSDIEGTPIVSPKELPSPTNQDFLFIAIGDGSVRKRIMNQVHELGWNTPSLIHPTAYVAPDAQIGKGVLVAAGAVVETMTKIGNGAIIDVGVVIDHEAEVGEFHHVRPGSNIIGKSKVP